MSNNFLYRKGITNKRILAQTPLANFVSWSLNFTSGTFSRADIGWYQLTGATTGSPAFLTSANANVLRFENMGDGAGALALFEGYKQNFVSGTNRGLGATWQAVGTTPKAAAQSTTDSQAATSLSGSSGSSALFQSVALAGVATNTLGVGSWWTRAAIPNISASTFRIAANNDLQLSSANGLTTTYRRISLTGSTMVAATNFFAADGRIGNGLNFFQIVDFGQYETGSFPTSVISCSNGLTGSRAADILLFNASQVPQGIFKGQFDQVSPYFSHVDLSGNLGNKDTEMWLLSFSNSVPAQDGIRIRFQPSDQKVHADIIAGGVIVVSSSALTFNRYALLGPLQWNGQAGTITFSGTTVTGTKWNWPAGYPIRVGGIYGFASESFCRLGNLKNS